MLLQVARVVEQLDLALEQLGVGDVDNARFAPMLTDNAVELSLHRLAAETRDQVKARRWDPDWKFEHQRRLDTALRQDLGNKLKLAEALGTVS